MTELDITSDEIELGLYWRNHPCDPMIPRYAPWDWFECDFLAVTAAGYTREYEIKTSRADYLKDFKKTGYRQLERGSWGRGQKQAKHQRLADGDCFPNYFWFVCTEGVVSPDEIPDYAGLLIADAHKSRVFFNLAKKAPRLHRNKIHLLEKDNIYQAYFYRFWAAEQKLIEQRRSRPKKVELTKNEQIRRRFHNRRAKLHDLGRRCEDNEETIREFFCPPPEREWRMYNRSSPRDRELIRRRIRELREVRQRLRHLQELDDKDSALMERQGIGRWL